ncbi:hypothetical protein MC885_011034 [Smutsia gigantea]|nr:hypothetical protein MC885_011034 [Smutsia gigantea]
MTDRQAVEPRRPAVGCRAAAHICDRDLGLRGSGGVLAGAPSSQAGRRVLWTGARRRQDPDLGLERTPISCGSSPPPPRRLLHAHGRPAPVSAQLPPDPATGWDPPPPGGACVLTWALERAARGSGARAFRSPRNKFKGSRRHGKGGPGRGAGDRRGE